MRLHQSCHQQHPEFIPQKQYTSISILVKWMPQKQHCDVLMWCKHINCRRYNSDAPPPKLGGNSRVLMMHVGPMSFFCLKGLCVCYFTINSSPSRHRSPKHLKVVIIPQADPTIVNSIAQTDVSNNTMISLVHENSNAFTHADIYLFWTIVPVNSRQYEARVKYLWLFTISGYTCENSFKQLITNKVSRLVVLEEIGFEIGKVKMLLCTGIR